MDGRMCMARGCHESPACWTAHAPVWRGNCRGGVCLQLYAQSSCMQPCLLSFYPRYSSTGTGVYDRPHVCATGGIQLYELVQL